MRNINGYPVAQLELMLRQKRQALTQRAASLKRQIRELERELEDVCEELAQVDRAENTLMSP